MALLAASHQPHSVMFILIKKAIFHEFASHSQINRGNYAILRSLLRISFTHPFIMLLSFRPIRCAKLATCSVNFLFFPFAFSPLLHHPPLCQYLSPFLPSYFGLVLLCSLWPLRRVEQISIIYAGGCKKYALSHHKCALLTGFPLT